MFCFIYIVIYILYYMKGGEDNEEIVIWNGSGSVCY